MRALRSIWINALVSVFLVGLGNAHAQTAPPGFTVSNYATGLPVSGGVTGLAIDAATRTIYYADQNTAGALRRIAPNRAVTTVTANMMGASGGFYPFVATDIEYFEGHVYYVDSIGFVKRINTGTGAVAVRGQFSGSDVEAGCTIRDGILYATDGNGTANALRTMNLTTLVQGTLASALPGISSSLEYNAVKDRYYFTDQGGSRVMQVTPAGVVTALGSGTNGAYNLAVEPNGSAVYTRDGTTVRRFDTSTGAATIFVNGLSGGFSDLVFGPSSTGTTFSLYIGDGTRIVEVAGFPGANQPPTVTAPDTIATSEDTGANFTVTTNDPEGDPDEPPVPAFSAPAKGTITGARTAFTYTPNPNANGADSFTITVEDPFGERAIHTVNVTITPVNDAPVFTSVPELLTVDEDAAAGFTVAATDVDGDAVTFTATNGAKGSVSGTGPTFTYTPEGNANGTDSFTVTAIDGNGGVIAATVNVTITPVNDPPVFTSVPEMLTTNEDTAANFNVAAGDLDGDAVTLMFTGAAQGTVSGSGENYTYTPHLHANGTDSFTITASDGHGGTVAATVTVTIVAVNDPPFFTSIPQSLTTDEDNLVRFNVAAGDVDGDSVAINSTNGQKGIVSGSGGDFTYTPNPDANGGDSFIVTASDGNGGTVSAEITVTIAPINDLPVFTSIPIKLTTDRDTATTFDVTTSDVEGDAVSLSFDGAVKGVVSGAGPSYTYTPNAGAIGIDTITVTATDAPGGTTTALIKVTIVAYPARYTMLLADGEGVHSLLTLKLNRRGSLSGAVRDSNNKRIPFRGKVPPPGTTSTTLSLKDGSSLVLEFDTRSRVTATLTTSGRIPMGSGNIALVPPDNVPGRYTVALDTGSGGFGWCLMLVDKRGSLRFAGKFPDGSALLASQKMSIDGENRTPVFLLGKGSAALLSGSLHFVAQPESDVSGALTFRLNGAESSCAATGARFTKATSALPPGSYPLSIEGGGVNQTSIVILNQNNTVTVSDPVVSLKPGGGAGRPASGVFTLKFRETLPDGKTPGEVLSGSGVFIQKLGQGFGQFVKDDAVGKVVIGPKE